MAAPRHHDHPRRTKTQKNRDCLRCDRTFVSAHTGNRLCDDCRYAVNEAPTPEAAYPFPDWR
jgi:protein-arginine kinase activator protein McsA